MSVGQPTRRWARPERFVCLGAAFAFLLLYVLTLAPTVQSGDAASFQARAMRPGFAFYARGYPIYTLLTKAFVHLPVGDVAYRVNLVSAVWAAVALWMMCGLVFSLTNSRTGAAFAAVALGLSHMFWAHAVRAEVWTMQVALMLGLMWALTSWGPGRPRPLYALSALLPAALFHHRMTLISVPVFAWFVLANRAQLRKHPRHAVGAAALGLVVVCGLFAWGYFGEWHRQTLRDAATRWLMMDPKFAPSLQISLRVLAYDAATAAAIFGYSLFGPALLLGVVGLVRAKALVGVQNARLLLLMLLVNLGFAALYSVGPDKPLTYFVPALAVWAVLAGVGMARLERGWSAATRLAVVAAQAGLLVLLYSLAPMWIAAGVQRLMPKRSVEEIRYWATPWARSEWQFRQRGEALLRGLPRKAVLLADWGTYGTLDYLRSVDGLRGDVRLLLAGSRQDAQWQQALARGDRRTLVMRSLCDRYKPPGCKCIRRGEVCEIRCAGAAAERNSDAAGGPL